MRRFLIAGFMLLFASIGYAAIGIAPHSGFQLIDGDWLNGLAGGHNNVFQNGIAAAGTSSQSGATQLADRIAFFEIDTVGANSGVALPAALAGTNISVYNSTATPLTVYPSITNNPTTGAQDTISNASSFSLAAHTGQGFTCAKNGIWFAN